MQLDLIALEAVTGRRGLTIAIAFSVLAVGGSFLAMNSARRSAETEVGWLRQRLSEKRALVHALQTDLADVAQATERVSQMAAMARDQTAAVRKRAQVEEPHDARYTPARLAALDDATVRRSDDAARTVAQLAFLEEQLASTTDSLALMMVLAKTPPQLEKVCAAPPSMARPAARPAVLAAAAPGGWPVSGEVSSKFGWRASPYGGGTQRHTGLDISAEYGSPVHVNAPGTVVFAGRDTGGYGMAVVVDHGHDVKTLYGHLSGIYVREGQLVARGTVLGAVGNSGRATGVHLHYEVRVGNVPVDPMLYVRSGGVQQVAAR